MNNMIPFDSKGAESHYARLKSRLETMLPTWHFEQYGRHGAIACFPPGGTGRDAFIELKQFAFISSVCGPLYVVSNLK